MGFLAAQVDILAVATGCVPWTVLVGQVGIPAVAASWVPWVGNLSW